MANKSVKIKKQTNPLSRALMIECRYILLSWSCSGALIYSPWLNYWSTRQTKYHGISKQRYKPRRNVFFYGSSTNKFTI